jgi:hypothetical protein
LTGTIGQVHLGTSPLALPNLSVLLRWHASMPSIQHTQPYNRIRYIIIEAVPTWLPVSTSAFEYIPSLMRLLPISYHDALRLRENMRQGPDKCLLPPNW